MSDAHFITRSFIQLILQTPIKYLLCAGHGTRVRAPEMRKMQCLPSWYSQLSWGETWPEISMT